MTTAAHGGLAPSRQELPNGAAIIAKESRMTPAVTLMAALRAGGQHDPDDRLGLAHFLSKTLDRGTGNRSADQIARDLDNRGVTLDVSATRHVLSVSCTCLAEDFEAMLALLGDIVRNPVFPEDEIETRRGEIVTSIRQDEDSPAVMALETLFEMLYPGGHPYGRRAKGTIATVGRIDRQALVAFHRTRVVPSALSLVVVGDVPVSRALAVAGEIFGSWEGPVPGEALLPPVRMAASRRQAVIPMMNKAQADVAYGFTTITRADPSYYACLLMNNVLGQYALGGRLGGSIRERQGMAYYAFSAFDANVGAGPLVIRAGVNPANVERAVASIDEEVRAMATDGVTASELEDSKRYLIGSMPRMLETNAGIAAFLHNAEMFGLGLDHDVQLPALLGAVTRDDVSDVARRFLAPERATVAIAGPYEPSSLASPGTAVRPA
ncbi:MAG: insulinase family protein [Acidobacteria bacterium]|nr:insulinase family protein [Acidobacteriota bacterium]